MDAAVEGILIAQMGIEYGFPAAGLASAIAIGMENGADLVIPTGWPDLDVEKKNESSNYFFFQIDWWMWPYFPWPIEWDDDGYYGGNEPTRVMFIATKNEQDASDNPVLMLPSLIVENPNDPLTIPMIITMSTHYTRKDPEESGDTQLSDDSIGCPTFFPGTDFTTSLCPTRATLH